MKLTRKSFGTVEGQQATLFIMENKHGMEVAVSDYGAIIVSIKVPDKNGKIEDVALGFDKVSMYQGNGAGYGSFIGRHCNRIGGAKFFLDGKNYLLEKNDGENNLHSGSKSYNKFFYESEIFEEEDEIDIEFSRLSPDMEQGFPGNLDVTVSYTLTEENELVLEYYAVSDQDTVVNLTNHSYFNLAGHASGSILNHKVKLEADTFTPTDASLIPTGEILAVTGTPMDFRSLKRIGEEIDANYEALVLAGGYDHNYILKHTADKVDKVAELWDEKSGRIMEVYTDLPGMQFYTGNFINGKETGKDGHIYQKRDGVCFETQYFPNACNIDTFPTSKLKAGQEYESVTVYKFSVR